MSAQKINTTLQGSSAITAEVGERIELVPVSAGIRTPYISFQFENDDPVVDLSGVANITRQEWIVFVNAKTFSVAERIKNTVINEFTGQKTEFYSRFVSSEHQFDNEAENHQFVLTFKITY